MTESMAGKSVRPPAYELTLLAIVAAVFVWSGIGPHDRFTWVLEVFPVIIGLRFSSTSILDSVSPLWPLGFQMQEWFGFARNHYDRIGTLPRDSCLPWSQEKS